MRKRTFGSWAAFLLKLGLLILPAMVFSFTLFTFANFSDHGNKLLFYIKTTDAEMTKRELINLHYFYDLSRRWKIQWLADKYLFRDAPFYEVADSYLIRDWKKVQNDLREKLDDSRAYPYGNAKFREVKAQFQAGKMSLEDALKITLSEIAADYEKALRNCLDLGLPYNQCYDRVWNYDLANNKKDAAEALKNPLLPGKYILGPPAKDGEPVLPPPLVPGGGKEDEEKPGFGGPRKRP